MIYKSVFVVGLLLVGNLAVNHIRDGYEMGTVVPPQRDLAAVPLQMGNWKGKELPADPRIREILKAKAGIDRIYVNQKAQDVLVHAVWTDDYLKLHFPQQCYRESGWKLTQSEDVTLDAGSPGAFPAKLLHFAQGNRSIQVLYWFQLGEHVFLDRVQHRLLRRQVCWGRKEWPPLMKFMLETEDSGLGRGQDALEDVAKRLRRDVMRGQTGAHDQG